MTILRGRARRYGGPSPTGRACSGAVRRCSMGLANWSRGFRGLGMVVTAGPVASGVANGDGVGCNRPGYWGPNSHSSTHGGSRGRPGGWSSGLVARSAGPARRVAAVGGSSAIDQAGATVHVSAAAVRTTPARPSYSRGRTEADGRPTSCAATGTTQRPEDSARTSRGCASKVGGTAESGPAASLLDGVAA